MNKPVKLLLAACIATSMGTLHADELDEITMGVIHESDISMDDVAQTIELPSVDELKAKIRERSSEDQGRGEVERNRLEEEQKDDQEKEDNGDSSELEDAKQEMERAREQEKDDLEEEKQQMEQEMEQEREGLEEQKQEMEQEQAHEDLPSND